MAKLSKDAIVKRIAEYRKVYKKETLYVTSDGNVFINENMAKAHAVSLLPKGKAGQKLEYITDTVKVEKPKADTGDMTEDKAKETLMSVVLDANADYNLLKGIVGALELEPKGKGKADYIEVLLPVQEQLKDAE